MDDHAMTLTEGNSPKNQCNNNLINKILNPLVNFTKDCLADQSYQLNQLYSGINQYQEEGRVLPATKQQIKYKLSQTYKFTQGTHHETPITSNTKLRTNYLHVKNLYKLSQSRMPQTRIELMEMAMSNKTILKETRKAVKSDDLQKKRRIINTIQTQINQDEINRKKKEHQLQLITQQQEYNKTNIGSMSLQMIADIRQKYFSELKSANTDDKFKRINEIKDVYIPNQLNQVHEGQKHEQLKQLREDLLSKKSQFNSYYQLLALESSLKRVVAMKLKPQIKSFSRFKGAEIPPNYHNIQSPVRSYIITQKHNESQDIN